MAQILEERLLCWKICIFTISLLVLRNEIKGVFFLLCNLKPKGFELYFLIKKMKTSKSSKDSKNSNFWPRHFSLLLWAVLSAKSQSFLLFLIYLQVIYRERDSAFWCHLWTMPLSGLQFLSLLFLLPGSHTLIPSWFVLNTGMFFTANWFFIWSWFCFCLEVGNYWNFISIIPSGTQPLPHICSSYLSLAVMWGGLLRAPFYVLCCCQPNDNFSRYQSW